MWSELSSLSVSSCLKCLIPSLLRKPKNRLSSSVLCYLSFRYLLTDFYLTSKQKSNQYTSHFPWRWWRKSTSGSPLFPSFILASFWKSSICLCLSSSTGFSWLIWSWWVFLAPSVKCSCTVWSSSSSNISLLLSLLLVKFSQSDSASSTTITKPTFSNLLVSSWSLLWSLTNSFLSWLTREQRRVRVLQNGPQLKMVPL